MTNPLRYIARILPTAEAVHCDYAGTGDSLPDETLRAYAAFLRCRSSQWMPTDKGKNGRYEAAVRGLLRAAETEACSMLEHRNLEHMTAAEAVAWFEGHEER